MHLLIDTSAQTLSVYDHDTPLKTYAVSTGKNGTGQLEGTGCTPLGKHFIAEKIGDGLPKNAVFVARQFTGEIYDDNLGKNSQRDWILSRILRLKGMEDGYNLGTTPDGICCDSYARYIYIHGTPDSEQMGIPLSHGCIRMRNDDVMALFDMASEGMVVEII